MIKPCIICGKAVMVTDSCEIVACENDNCIRTVENHISIHYQTPVISSGHLQINRNDFYLDLMGDYHRTGLGI